MIKANEILILKEAAEDLQDGRKFYSINGASVGNYFWDSLLSDLDSLAVFAGTHVKYQGLYKMLSKRFPYAIYYQIKKANVYVVAILPIKRNPVWIEQRLKSQ